jgi:hypothetical protein
MNITVLTSFLTMMVAISVASERMVEILKGWFPNFYLFASKSDPTQEMRRGAFVHVLAGICGAIVAWLGHLDVFAGIGSSSVPSWVSCAGAGLLASGGSAFWNHALDLIRAAKVNKEQTAIRAVATNQQQNLLSPAHPDSLALAMSRSPLSFDNSVGSQAGCVIQPDPSTGGFKAPRGTLAFKLNVQQGSFNFVPTNCSVKDPSNKNVPFTQATPGLLDFTAATPGSYTLTVLYQFTPGSKAQLLEDCTQAQPLDNLDSTVSIPTIYPIQIS